MPRSIGQIDRELLRALFTSSNLNRLAWHGHTPELAAAREELVGAGQLESTATLGDLFDSAFQSLLRHDRVEYVYKSCVLHRLLFGVHSPKTTAFYSEHPVADSRADVLLINGNATVYEIKTQYDDFDRLDSQLADYYRCFRRVVLLCDPSTAELALRRLPDHVGVAAIGQRYSLTAIRPAADYSSALDHRSLFGLLQQDEYRSLVAAMGFDTSSIHPADLYETCLDVFGRLPVEECQLAVAGKLKTRQRTARIAKLCEQLPRSLGVAAFSFRLRQRDWMSIVELTSEPA